MMITQATRRAAIALGVLSVGLAAQTALEASMNRPSPRLQAPLSTIPLNLAGWIGRDEPMDPDILERTQCDAYINRSYEDPRHPGRTVKLWINFSDHGLNLRHSPEVCLPSGGWTKVEAMTQVATINRAQGKPHLMTRLGYSQGDSVQGIAFWYYIFGEGPVEHFVRQLPIGSRSSHGRATRGSGLTVEIFYPGETEPNSAAIQAFASALLDSLDPILPTDRAAYHIP